MDAIFNIPCQKGVSMAKGVRRDDDLADLARLGVTTYDDDGHYTTDGFEIAYIRGGKSESDEIIERELTAQDSLAATKFLHDHGCDAFGNLVDESKLSTVENNGNSSTVEADNDSSSTADEVIARLRAMM